MKVAFYDSEGICRSLLKCKARDLESNVSNNPGMQYRILPEDNEANHPSAVPNLTD